MKLNIQLLLGILLFFGITSASAQQPAGTKTEAAPEEETQQELAPPVSSVIDEVIWVVGDEPILKSDVEAMRLQSEAEGVRWFSDPDCSIPEQIALQKLFLHQAAIDSLEVTESEITQGVEEQINRWIQMVGGSAEKLEEYQGKSLAQIRLDMRDDFRNSQLVQKMRQKIAEDVSVTPSEVRNYFKNIPEDSIPFVPMEVEVEIITIQPRIPIDEINRIKDELREYTDRVTKGETTFATLARLYSEDPGTARQGGELGYTGRGVLDPAFASVAFNLTDPKKISKIVETEFGYHIIQLIDKRGDKVNVRHILRKPQVAQEQIKEAIAQLDSIAADIREEKITFELAATMVSDDKDTRNNRGLMAFVNPETGSRTSHFQMKDLPTEVARAINGLNVGDISQPFTMINSKGKQACAIVKLRNRIEGHKATITEDYQVMQAVVLNKRRQEVLHDWVTDKIKHTYVWMDEKYKGCTFEYDGWIK